MILYPPLLKRGITLAPWLVLIPKWAKGSEPYRTHELIHVQQQRNIGTLTFWWRYLTDKAFRQSSEVDAYRAQVKAGDNLYVCAYSLSSGYGLDISVSQALELLEKPQDLFDRLRPL